MEDNKEQIVNYIVENDCKWLKDHFDSITNKSEANYSLLKIQQLIRATKRTMTNHKLTRV